MKGASRARFRTFSPADGRADNAYRRPAPSRSERRRLIAAREKRP